MFLPLILDYCFLKSIICLLCSDYNFYPPPFPFIYSLCDVRVSCGYYRRHIPRLTQKNGLFCNREQPNLFLQVSSLYIMDVLRHKRFGCSDVYDSDLLRRDESGGFVAKYGKNWMNAAAFGGKLDGIWIFC